jgi:hypothetical protein
MVESLGTSLVASANQDYVVKPYGLDCSHAMLALLDCGIRNRHLYHPLSKVQ